MSPMSFSAMLLFCSRVHENEKPAVISLLKRLQKQMQGCSDAQHPKVS